MLSSVASGEPVTEHSDISRVPEILRRDVSRKNASCATGATYRQPYLPPRVFSRTAERDRPSTVPPPAGRRRRWDRAATPSRRGNATTRSAAAHLCRRSPDRHVDSRFSRSRFSVLTPGGRPTSRSRLPWILDGRVRLRPCGARQTVPVLINVDTSNSFFR